jgi:hypothetical protein
VCDEFEQDNKKGGVPAAKRIFKFNQKLQKYNELRDKANRLGITDLSGYALIDGKWYEKYTALGGIRYLAIRCKDRDAEKQLNEIAEKLNEIEVEHKDEERT